MLCVEAKSRTVHEDQAHKYRGVRPANLVSTANLPPGMEPVRLSHDVIYTTSRNNAAAVARQLTDYNVPFPVVAGDHQLFDLASGSIGQADVHNTFSEGIEVREAEWPLHFVPFNSRSSHGEVVPYVAHALSRFIIGGRDFTVEDLAAAAVRHWVQCGRQEQQGMRDRLVGLVDDAMVHELKGYYERLMPARSWRLVRARPTGPQALARLSRLAVDFVERVQSGRPFTPAAVQTSLPEPFFRGMQAASAD